MNIALTQRLGQLEGLHEALEVIGHTVIRAPLIATTYERDADLTSLEGCPWWLFTSSSAVASLTELGGFKRGGEAGVIADRVKIGAVGETTAAALRKCTGLEVDLLSPDGTARGLALALLERSETGPFGWPHGDHALPDLRSTLLTAGLTVHGVVVYRTSNVVLPDAFSDIGRCDVVVLASPSAARNLPQQIGNAAQIVALGTSTAAAAHARGWRVVTATEPTVLAVLAVLQKLEVRPRSSDVGQEPALSEMESARCQG